MEPIKIIKHRRRLNADDIEKALAICLCLKNTKQAPSSCFLAIQSIDAEYPLYGSDLCNLDSWNPQSGLVNWKTLCSFGRNPVTWWSSKFNQQKSRKILIIPPFSLSTIMCSESGLNKSRLMDTLKINESLENLRNDKHLPTIIIVHNPNMEHWNILIRTGRPIVAPNEEYRYNYNMLHGDRRWIIVDSLGPDSTSVNYAKDVAWTIENKITGGLCNFETVRLFRQQSGWDCGYLTIAAIDWILKTSLRDTLEDFNLPGMSLDEYMHELLYTMIEKQLNSKTMF